MAVEPGKRREHNRVPPSQPASVVWKPGVIPAADSPCAPTGAPFYPLRGGCPASLSAGAAGLRLPIPAERRREEPPEEEEEPPPRPSPRRFVSRLRSGRVYCALPRGSLQGTHRARGKERTEAEGEEDSIMDESQLRNLKAQYEAQNASTAASQIQVLVDCVNTLKIKVGVLGPRGAGVSTLVQAVLDKPRRVTDPRAYFRETPEPTKQLVAHIHPVYPNLTLCDLPGFEVSEKPATYLKRLGDLSKYNCFVVVVSTTLGDTHLQVLKDLRQKGKTLFLVRTKVDLDLHTAERRLRFKFNCGEQLGQIRKELTETLAKNGMDTKRVFLVSGLETERYEFTRFEDSLEGEMLSLKRSLDGDLEDLNAVSQKKIEELYNISKSGSLSEVPDVICSALVDSSQIRLDVAVIGEVGSGKSSLVNALRGVAAGESGAAPTGVTGTTRKATDYLLPTVPYMHLWDLPGVGVTEEDVSHLDLSRYDLFLLVASERYKHVHSCLARAIAAAGKDVFFVRSKIEVDMEAQPGSKPIPKEELRELVRKNCTEALKKDGIPSPQVFLVSSLMQETYDLPLLQEALSYSAPDLKRKALRRAIPTVLSRLVRRKSKVLMKDVWMKALQTCLYCVERPNPDVAESLITYIASFCIDLGLDGESVEHTARVTGKAVTLLQAQIRSPFAKPLDSKYVLSLITKPVSMSTWAWSYVPYLGRGTNLEPEISFESIYRMLKQVVVELSEDAERVLFRALMEE
ncbi:interferon-inducible GTPase 5-like [Eublepharis macularius]|uniref:Interferon-inducible GTPase 5-like n=1 Tax=Eublepharis macularius TaxID=481883 RepID=A0AA97LGU8_EUBMA|nr:interferon-inducible GTPase 5-like [Eublepharis macularius]